MNSVTIIPKNLMSLKYLNFIMNLKHKGKEADNNTSCKESSFW